MSKTYTKEERVLLALIANVESHYSKSIATAIDDGGILHALRSCKMPKPSEYSDPDAFRLDYLLSCYLSKFENGSNAETLAMEAERSFLETEQELKEVNEFLSMGSAEGGVEGILSDARRKILHILSCVDGSDPHIEFNFDEMILGCDMGPGATATLKGVDATLDKKILEPHLSVTSRALKYAQAYFAFDTSWASARLGYPLDGPVSLLASEFQIQEYDRFTTVPKNWKTRRSIAIQPTMNIFFQKGVGAMIRRRLRRSGIDLDDQSRNQKLAQRSYKEGYATIDLAKASDTVSYEIVRQLIPNAWFSVLEDLRTDYTKIGDKCHALEKFSAMGNGFTFELESLIFYALLFAVVRNEADDWDSEIAVYGDDLIVASKHYERVCQVLRYCGFRINDEKSFATGPFYESCGKHFFHGADVTPVYQKKALDSLPELIRAANRLFRWALDTHSRTLDSRAREAWELITSWADQSAVRYLRKKSGFVPRMPWYLEGDDAMLTPEFDRFFHRKKTGESWYISTISFTPTKVDADGYALLCYTLRKGVCTDSPFNGLLSLRGYGTYRYSSRVVLRRVDEVVSWI